MRILLILLLALGESLILQRPQSTKAMILHSGKDSYSPEDLQLKGSGKFGSGKFGSTSFLPPGVQVTLSAREAELIQQKNEAQTDGNRTKTDSEILREKFKQMIESMA